MTTTLMAMLIASVLAIGGTALLGVRMYVAKVAVKQGVGSFIKVAKARTKAAVAGCLATATLVTSTGVVAYRDWTADQESNTPPKATAADTDTTSNALPALTLTEKQIQEILSKYSFTFNDIGLASRVRDRIDAIAEYEETFSDPVNVPIAEVLDKMDEIKKMDKDEQYDFYNEEVREIVYKTIAGDPQYAEMFVKEFLEQELITENNGDLFEEASKLYDDAYDPKVKTDRDGLDYFLNADLDTCSDEYQRKVFVQVRGILEYAKFEGITNATSTRNYCAGLVAEDSMTRTTLARYQENRAALKIVFYGKDGSEQIVFGINLLDRRLEVFEPGKATTKNPTTPSKPAPSTPTDTSKYVFVVTHVIAGTEDQLIKTHKKTNLSNGASYSYEPPQSITTSDGSVYVMQNPGKDSYISGKIAGANVYRTVNYVLQSAARVNPLLTVRFEYEDGTTAWPTYSDRYAPGAWYSVEAKPIRNYTATLGREKVSFVEDYMPDTDLTLTVVYRRNTATLTIEYLYKDTKREAAETYVKDYDVGEPYFVKSPPVKGYKPSIEIVEGDMVFGGVKVTVYYTAADYRLTILYVDDTNPSREVARPSYEYHAEGESFRVYPKDDVEGYVPKESSIRVDMPGHDHTVVFHYVTETDGKGGKDKVVDPSNQGTADEGGGLNQKTDSTGNDQKGEPDRNDYPDKDNQHTVINGSNDSNTTVKPNDSHEGGSSGTGGVDHAVTGNNPGDKVDNGEIPDKSPIDGTTASGVDKVTGGTSTPADEKDAGTMQMPD